MKQKIVIAGSGEAGTALHASLSRAGYEVRSAKKAEIPETRRVKK